MISAKQKGPERKYYTLTRRYYIHGTYQLFCHVIIDIKKFGQNINDGLIICLVVDGNGQHHKYALILYLFDGPKVEVKVKPYGNSKHARPYFCTSETTKKYLHHRSLRRPLIPS